MYKKNNPYLRFPFSEILYYVHTLFFFSSLNAIKLFIRQINPYLRFPFSEILYYVHTLFFFSSLNAIKLFIRQITVTMHKMKKRKSNFGFHKILQFLKSFTGSLKSRINILILKSVGPYLPYLSILT